MTNCAFVQPAIPFLEPVHRVRRILQDIVIGVGFIGAGATNKEGALRLAPRHRGRIWVIGIICRGGRLWLL